MHRRKFLYRLGTAIGASAVLPKLGYAYDTFIPSRLDTWADVRSQFSLTPDYIHMAQMLLASHPTPVRAAIEKHRKAFDENPVDYLENNWFTIEPKVRQAAANYLKVDPEEVVMTDSTTMGLGILYTGFQLQKGDDILTTTHDHYATEKSLEYAAMKNEASIRRIALYDDASQASIRVIVDRLVNAILPNTKLVAVTWVHSCSGVRLPIRAMADAIKTINEERSAADRIYFCVDGVHGFGVEDVTMEDLGCDFFAAGTHKWIFGPRGTGILWGKKDAWDKVIPTIPPFSGSAYGMWLGYVPKGKINFSDYCTPGGFHSFEHRWALKEAFEFHLNIGKAKIEERTRQLNTMLKEGLKEIKHLRLHTPMDGELSSAINCFEVEGLKPQEIVTKLHKKHIIASTSPYRISYARLTPGVMNTEEEVMTCIKALEDIKA